MKRLTTIACLAVALLCAVGAFAGERNMSSQPAMLFGDTGVKASGDTVDLMGPGAGFPYRGDFENASARPGGAGLLPNGWSAVDLTQPANHWHVDTIASGTTMTGQFAWCGDAGIASCGVTDPLGGYANSWRDILEFRKTVAGASTVRVQGTLQYDSEPGYDYTTLQRRTAANPNFEAITGGQGLSYDGAGYATIDYTFTYTPAELYLGTDVAVAFIFDSDGGWSDGDCSWPTAGAARLDDLTVTLNGVPYTEDFEDGLLGPDWTATPNVGVGDFARVWGLLGDADDCASNYSKLVAFIDDGLVVPGTGGTVGGPGNDYGPPGGYIVNNTGGLLGPTSHIECAVNSPVMPWPDPAKGGMTYAFDIYRHELLTANDSPGIFYTWSVRSTAGGSIASAGWVDRNFVYYGGPNYLRTINVVDDLIEPGATQLQVQLGVIELGWAFGYGNGTNGTPAPYFDNASVKIYPASGARMSITEIRLANDAFPAIGDVDLTNLENNSCRFDMAANISLKTHLRNDPGDSIWIDATARAGGALVGVPTMYWQFAVKNPLFTDAHRVALTAGQTSGSVTGLVTKNSAGVVVANRFNFDLPDTGMLFPGDVLHYYFATTDQVGADVRTAYAPFDRSGLGNATPMAYPGFYTVNCLPSVTDVSGAQPTLLFWNDFGFRGGEDEWYGALRGLGLVKGVNYDVFATHGPSSGVSNGLGGRATVNQIDGYTDMLYTAGDLSSPTLSNGDYNGDAGNDLGLINSWFALGNRDLFMTGDDLASGLYGSGTVARTFLESKMGLTYNVDTDVRDNIAGQTAPLVVKIAGNPVFTTANSWVAYGGCFGINDFDNVVTFGSATRLAQFTAPGGASTPYPYAAATLNIDGTNRVVSMNHDLLYVIDPAKAPAAPPARTVLLSNVLDYFGVSNNLGTVTGVETPGAKFAVQSYPNPFNPTLKIAYTLKNPGNVVMKVYNVRGELVKTLLNSFVETPTPIMWDGTNDQGSNVSSGVYFVETRSGGDVNVQKATMVK
jgi:hypothetical protein